MQNAIRGNQPNIPIRRLVSLAWVDLPGQIPERRAKRAVRDCPADLARISRAGYRQSVFDAHQAHQSSSSSIKHAPEMNMLVMLGCSTWPAGPRSTLLSQLR